MCSAHFGARAHLDNVAAPIVAATELAAAAVRKQRAAKRLPRGQTLRAGIDTPHWNQLATAVAKSLRRRGDKARLARELGISRQRLHMLVVARTAYPDAERALQMLEWLQRPTPRPAKAPAASVDPKRRG